MNNIIDSVLFFVFNSTVIAFVSLMVIDSPLVDKSIVDHVIKLSFMIGVSVSMLTLHSFLESKNRGIKSPYFFY